MYIISITGIVSHKKKYCLKYTVLVASGKNRQLLKISLVWLKHGQCDPYSVTHVDNHTDRLFTTL